MAIRDTKVVAFEGAHGSGKTTLVHATVGLFRSRHINATDVPESARSSPFFQSALIYGRETIDEWAELHLLGDQIATEQVRARTSELLVTDRTVLNVASYWRVRMPEQALISGGLFSSTRSFAISYSRRVYDLVFLLTDNFLHLTDGFRETDERFRRKVQEQLELDLAELGIDLVRIPSGLDLPEKLQLVSEAIDACGLVK
jgi:nicotinamide riboside kinase